jgi:hypothetical protein
MSSESDKLTIGKEGGQQQQQAATAEQSELSIYVVKNTSGVEGAETVTFDVGQNGRTYLVGGDREAALDKIAEILDGM